jgi:hypothetical protein
VQGLTDGVRAGLTADQVRYLIGNAASVNTAAGMELVDQNGVLLEDITDWLETGSVSRDSFADIHGTASFEIGRELDWGAAIVRPYYLMTGPLSAAATTLTTVRFNLGAYFTEVAEEELDDEPATFSVTGHDIVSDLDDPVGDGYSVTAGTFVLDLCEQILQSRGWTNYVIDDDQRATTIASPLTWTIDDNVTWLGIINTLLTSVGYGGIWSDWNGALRLQRYIPMSDRPPEWVFDVSEATSLMEQGRRRARDYYNAPNRWVFYRGNATEEGQPADDAGRFEYVNETTGPTSVEARGGRIKSRSLSLDAADHDSLVAAAWKTIDADISLPAAVTLSTAPFPLAWHLDKYQADDPRIGPLSDVTGRSWTLPLDGSAMSHEWALGG